MPTLNFARFLSLVFVFSLYITQALAQCAAEITPSGALTFCQGGSVKLTASAGVSFSWYEEGKTESISTAQFIDVNKSGKYSVKITFPDPATCPEATSSKVEVIVNPLPVTPEIISDPNSAECPGSIINFKINNPQEGVNYFWDFGDPDSGNNTATGQNTNHAFSPSGTNTTYNVTVKAISSTGCLTTSTKSVQVKSSPKIVIIDDEDNFKKCLNANSSNTSWTFNFQNNSISGDPTTYKWSWGDGTPDEVVTDKASKSHTYNGYGVYNLVITATNQSTNCISIITKKIIFEKYPSASLQIPPAQVSICEGDVITITNNSINATSYKWDWGDGTITETTSKDSQSHVYNLTRDQACNVTGQGVEMKVTLYAINDCQTHSNTSPIYVLPKPKPLFSVSKNKACKTSDALSSTVSFTNSSCPTTGYDDKPKFVWDFGDPNSGLLNTSTVKTPPDHYYAQPGLYTITLTATNSCGSETYTKQIQVDSPPTSSFQLSQASICKNENLTTVNTSAGDGITYLWSVSPSSNFSYVSNTTSNSKEPVFNFQKAGSYTVSLTVTNACETRISSKIITVKSPPNIGLPVALKLCGPQQVNYGSDIPKQKVTFNNNNGLTASYIWTITGTSGATFTDNTTATSQYPAINFPTPGTYTVSVSATNECGTSSLTSQAITILTPPGQSACFRRSHLQWQQSAFKGKRQHWHLQVV